MFPTSERPVMGLCCMFVLGFWDSYRLVRDAKSLWAEYWRP